MKKLAIVVNCGDTTCASSKGVFCHRLNKTRMGLGYYACSLFINSEGFQIRLHDKDGWIQRCPECLASSEELQ